MKILLLTFLILSQNACAGTMQTARTNGAGAVQLGLEPGVTGAFDANTSNNGLGGVGVLPSMNVALRYGISDSVDIGARVGLFRYGLNSKIMLSDPEEYDQGIALSLAPSVNILTNYLFDSTSEMRTTVFSDLPLLIGIPIADDELVLSPKVTPMIAFGRKTGESANFMMSAGMSIGYAWKLASRFWLLPEVGADVPFLGGVLNKDVSSGYQGVLFNAGVGLLFGGRVRHPTP